ncbi:Hint domain-containing protein [Falsirhodobacter halotolerans]|uniref:Hint domain-containing protein n=1 Tax=Falsirhodobacter halotolerans TaxID=1146892 RepID=UPI001FD57966|nr:Hint domain-containing protein [Falsirhodobacter halotolerans]MCJ8139068.1 Hint domain-containing protein [Falsirhodobacter halotolerans]
MPSNTSSNPATNSDQTVQGAADDGAVTGGGGSDIVTGGPNGQVIRGDGPVEGQWSYAVYDRDFDGSNNQAPTITSGELVGSGYVTDFDVGNLANVSRGTPLTNDANDFGVIFTSTLNVTSGGTYTLTTSSDDGSRVIIRDADGNALNFTNADGAVLPYLNNDYHQGTTERSATVQLDPNQTYSIEIQYWENGGADVLQGSITGPDTGGARQNLANSTMLGVPPAALNQVDGNDTLYGGEGADTLYGDGGDDTIYFGRTDEAYGGTGNDRFIWDADTNRNPEAEGGVVTIDGGAEDLSDGGLGDTLDLGTLTQDYTVTITETNGPSKSGNVVLADGTIINFTNIERIVCFTSGTMIQTVSGPRAIETLAVGDLVVTRDNGLQPVRWIGTSTVSAQGDFAPIRISSGAIPELQSDILVSPQHRMLIEGYRAELLFGQREVFVSARHMVDGKFVTVDTQDQITYIHLLFDQHEVIFANGVPSESFHPGSYGVDGMNDRAREELFALFPTLRSSCDAYGKTARRVLKRRETAALLA